MLRRVAIGALIAILLGCAQGSASAAKKAKKRPSAISCSSTHTLAVDKDTRERASGAVLCLINRQRRAHGLRPVRASKPLESASSEHSRAMVRGKFISHGTPGGDSARLRIRKAGYVRRSRSSRSSRSSRHSRHSRHSRQYLIGETLTWGSGPYATPVQLVGALMESTAHRRTLLDKRFRDVGVGMALGAPIANVGMDAATVTIGFGRR